MTEKEMAQRVATALQRRGMSMERLPELSAALRSSNELTTEQRRDLVTMLEVCRDEWYTKEGQPRQS